MGIFLWHEAYLVGADESIARIKHAKCTKGKKGEKEVRQAMVTLNIWCKRGLSFRLLEAGVVEGLLKQTLVESMIPTFRPIRARRSMCDCLFHLSPVSSCRDTRNETYGTRMARFSGPAIWFSFSDSCLGP